MAEAQAAVDTSNDRRNHYSRPIFKQVLKVNSLQAQRVMKRSFERVSNSLFSIDVILRIIGEQDEIDQVESVILEHISKVSEDLDKAIAQLNKLMEDNGIDMMPGYTHPNEYTIEIHSPQVALCAHLIRKLGELMGIVETLWLNTVLTSKQRTDATYQWQQRLIKLAGRIIGIEKRARISAHSKGKEGEVAQAEPESETGDKKIEDKAAKSKVKAA
ncbi:hypothetical protein BJP41_10240 (plasmid) [Candidatus Williamhamiltonella defendens]|uniref:DUF1845 domain-containing protein n=1 Tax=Candidatus Williamhamiltonella defendens TaxID=138072 RepID=A0A2D3TB33_9ENTR|nr:hypothetical protein [Candidatus Hamiltonella defensa]ATW30892.1 hypothetical protein BJP41_10215 [Candidatus Hamiltonella defensa]ATW30893.1 hypothetical protein BJP41_10240 [Candidatus Hamiltonella defensa]ATW32914.1 hypothetical protein BJP42_11070 [Candidatus Hamiltonella defensa]ATW32919.1 hypothetical protein BJP42_11095 [Candidatus Hamiltonella defensa]